MAYNPNDNPLFSVLVANYKKVYVDLRKFLSSNVTSNSDYSI